MTSKTTSRFSPELERQAAARAEARRAGQELLTPLGAVSLFKKSPEAVRKAASKAHVEVVFDLWATERSVSLIHLQSAVEYWGEPDPARLDAMREEGHLLAANELIYNVLHPKPLLTLRNADEMDGDV